MIHLEGHEELNGSTTAIFLNDTVLHTRFTLSMTRIVSTFLKFRPVGQCACHAIPVYIDAKWKCLFVFPVNNYALVISASLRTKFSTVRMKMEEFMLLMSQSRLEIPLEVILIMIMIGTTIAYSCVWKA